MVTFHTVHVSQTRRDPRAGEFPEGWAVERTAPGDGRCLVTRLYKTRQEAESEAYRLNTLGIERAGKARI